jgi:hypothetical protein
MDCAGVTESWAVEIWAHNWALSETLAAFNEVSSCSDESEYEHTRRKGDPSPKFPVPGMRDGMGDVAGEVATSDQLRF